MPTIRRNPCSCGSQLLYDLHGADEAWLERTLRNDYVMYYARPLREPRPIYKGETIIFSDRRYPNRASPGMKLAALIRKHRLGRVTEVKAINPNTKHAISTWVWVYNGNLIKDKPTKAKKEDKEKQPEVTQ